MNIYEESNGEYSLQIREDENPISPRQMNANMGKMICFHPRYILGDRHSYKNKDEFLLDLLTEHFNDEKRAKEYWDRINSNTSFIPPFASEKLRDDVIIKELSSDHIIIPVFLYDHSGLSVSVNSFHDAWDSGQVGWIYADKQTVIKEYGKWSDETIKKAKQFMAEDMVEARRIYAREIIKMYHGEEFVLDAENRYNAISNGLIPDNIDVINISKENPKINITDLLVSLNFVNSKSEAKRMISQRAVKINDNVITDINYVLDLKNEIILKYGKNKVIKII